MKISRVLSLILACFLLCSNFSPSENVSVEHRPQQAYTTSQDLKTITPIDLETGETGKAIHLEFSPKSIVVSEKTQKAYILQQDSYQIIPIDLHTGVSIEAIVFNEKPKQMVVSKDGNLAYIITEDSNELLLLDLETEIPAALLSLEKTPSCITLSHDGKLLYATHLGLNEVTTIDLDSVKAKSSIFLNDEPVAIAVTTDGHMASVGHTSINQLNFFDIETGYLDSFLTVDGDDEKLIETIHVSSDGQKAYLTRANSTTITPINLKERKADKAITIDHNIQSFALIEKQDLVASFSAEIKPVGKPSFFEAKRQHSFLGDAIQYIWDFGDDQILTTEVPFKSHTYKKPGKYFVTLTVKEVEKQQSNKRLRSASVTKQFQIVKAENPLSKLNLFLAQTEITTTSLNASPNPSVFGQSVTFTANVISPGPGTPTGTVEFFDGATSIGTGTLSGGIATVATSALSIASHTITAEYSGDLTFFPSTSGPLTQVVNQATTTTALSSSLNPSAFGQSVTFTATVTSSQPGTPTGTVEFFDGATSIGTGTLSGGIATIATSALSVGSHTITADYSGDSTFLSSISSGLTQVVNQGTTTTAVSSSLNPSRTGQNVTFTATVTISSGSGTLTGTVTFKDGLTTLGTGTISGSVATFATSSLAVGPHSITAVYNGDTNFSGSTSSALTQTVNQGTTTITVTSSANPSIFGNSITLTATLNVTAGVGTPTGTVTFRDGATTIGTGTVTAGVATFATSALSVGSHTITAVYAGDVNFSGSTSPNLTQIVNQGSTTTTVTSSLNPSTYGASVTFTSSTIVSTGVGVLSGNVTFFDGATSLGSSSIDLSGVATFSITSLSVGTHSITTVYNGDTNFLTSTSPILSQIVDQATPLVSVTSSLNPSMFSDLVTFTGTVSSPTLLGLPGGTISFYDGATLLSTATLIPTGANTSAASLAISTLISGPHSITVVYSGDTNFTTLTSAPLVQVVGQVSTTQTTVFSNSPNPTHFGQPVVLRANVIGSVSNPVLAPTGTIIFYDGVTVLGTVPVSSIFPNVSTATLTVSTLSIGAHAITASYQGDTNYPASTSPAFTQNVIQTGTSSVVTSSNNPSVFGETVTFSADVSGNSPGMGNATGFVEFYDGSDLLGTGTLVATGPNTSTATFSTSGLILGSHNIFTVFNGDTNFTSSSSPILKQIVNKDTTTTSLTSSLNPSNFGDLITLTATIAANPPGSGTPTGTVQFFDGATLLATRPIVAGSASYSTIALYPGAHPLRAVYSGDTNFITSTSVILTQNVLNQLPTVTTVTSTRNSSPTGQSVTYRAAVTAITGIPTGTVTFYNLTVSPLPIGTGTLINGVATFTEPGVDLVAIGAYDIQAVYNGDANFITSTSAIYDQYIVPLDTTTTLTTNPNPSEQANATLTATVTIISGVGPLTGTVSFYEDGVLIPGTVTFNTTTGVATLMPNNLHFGLQPIVAIYSGDNTTFATSTSNTVNQMVQQTSMLRTNTVLTTSLATAYFCQPITLTATVSEAEGFYIPTGSVTFFSNGIEIGAALLNNLGIARLPISSLPVGTTTLSATYNSDSNYAFSRSNNVTQTILANNTTTALSVIPNLSSTPYTNELLFTARVTSTYALPTGTVSFYDGTTLLETAALDGAGKATYQTDLLATGVHTINATYNSDPCFNTSSATLNHTITKISPIVSFTGSPNPSVYGEDILLTATLSSASGEVPTGTISFYNGATFLGTVTMQNGVASWNVTGQPAGVMIVKGVYSGDSNYIATNLPSFVQTINKATTSTCLDSFSSNPTQYGQIISFSATVSSSARTPTGNVVFRDGSTIIGTVPLDGCSTATLDTSNLDLGANTITALYIGDSNFLASTSNSVIQNITQADTETIVVSSTPNPSVFNSLVTFNVAVKNLGTGSQIPTGTISGYFGSTLIGTGTLSNGLASFSTSDLPAGVDTVIIKYSGDTNFLASTVATTQTVTTLSTTATLTSSNNPSVSGQPVTFSVNVTSTGGTPTGTVAFLEGTITLGTATLNVNGQASLTLSNLSTATHPIRVVYSGSSNLSSSTSNIVSQVVNRASTTTTLSSTNNPSFYGENVTFNAFVATTSPGTGVPAGTVTFRNGATTIGSGAVNSAGFATFTISSLAVASSPYSITAVYGGNANFLTSTSSVLSEVINKSATITSATATPNPSNLGDSVTLNVTVLPVNTVSGIPTGTVTALYGSTVVGTASLNGSGQATFSTSTLPAGNLAIVVRYAGDTNYLGSSTTVTEKITQNTSSIALTSSLNPSTVGQNVTFTAQVTSTSGTPTGTVAYFDGTSPIGTVTLNASGVATLVSSNLTLGTHSITAVYRGDVNNLGSTSSVLSQVVNQTSTTTTLSSTNNPSFFGENITFNALVTQTSGNIIPTGIVTFRNGAATLGTGTVNSAGLATFTISSLAVSGSPYSITAVYGGDVNFSTSTSSILSQVINKSATITTAAATPNPAALGGTVTFNVTVASINTGSGIPTGTVTALYGSTVVGTASLNGLGQATFTSSTLPAGNLGIVIQYAGDTNYLASSTSITQKITQNTSTTALTSSLNPSTVGQNVTLTAQVTSTTGTPTGTVAYFDGTSPIGTVTLNASGVATLVSSNLTLGTHSITAVYSGDVNNLESTSSVLSQVVNQANTVTTIVSSTPNPSMLGEVVNFFTTVTTNGSLIPTGNVTFFDGVTSIGTIPLIDGSGIFSTSTLSVGAHSITAVYNGNANLNTSTSSISVQTVNQNSVTVTTVTTLTSSLNPSDVGDAVTFNVNVAPIAGAGTPTGSVTLYYGSTPLATLTLVSGAASYITSALPAGSLNIVALYSGDATFSSSTTTLSQIVHTVPIVTTTTLYAIQNPSEFGNPVTFKALVTKSTESSLKPTGTVTFKNGLVTLGTVSVDINGEAFFSTSSLSIGVNSITAIYNGNANFITSTSTVLSQTVNKTDTIVSATSTPNPVSVGNAVTFNVKVSPINMLGVFPSGTVNAYYGSTLIGTATLNGTSEATITSSTLPAGTLGIMVNYLGDINFNPSTMTLTQTVNQATSSTVLTSSVNPSLIGEPITFTATVSSAFGIATGTATFYDGPSIIGVQTLNGSGVATLTVSNLNLSTHVIKAIYSGSSSIAGSTSTNVTQVVNQSGTTTTLTSSLNPSVYLNNVTFAAQVVSTTPGSGIPTGFVTFKDGATIIGIANVNTLGQAVLTTNSLLTGTHSITADYSGDTNFANSTSSALSQVVTQASSVTTLVTSIPNPSMFGQVVTFFATVEGNSTFPTGTVTFYDGLTAIGTVPINDGLGIFATGALSLGTHQITAAYNGDSNFTASVSSPPYAQVVNQTNITVTTVTNLTSSLNPSNYGDLITFDVDVVPIAGPGTPTGFVTIYHGSVPLTTLPLVGGHISYSTSDLPAGNLNIVALYSGDSAYSSSTSTIIQIVNLITTTTTLTSSANPSNFTDPVVFNVTVTSSNSATPTGSITFFDDATIVGSVLLNNSGQGTLTISNLVPGNHVISAVYNADPNFLTSSDSLIQVVAPAPTTTVILLGNPNPSRLGETVTFIATTVSGGNNVTGTLTFYDGVTVLGTAPLYNGLSLFSNSTLAVGSHSITASYSGNTDFAISTSLPYTQIVEPSTFSTATTLTSSLNPSELSQSVTFTAQVTSGSGIATGTVSFFDGPTSIGTVVLNASGTAALTTSTLSEGSHSITAIYSGDANYGGSVSDPLTQIVGESSIPTSPTNFQGCQFANKFLNESSLRNRLTWDPPSSGATPTAYRIYSNANLTHLIAEVPAGQHIYEVLNVKKQKKYQYYIVTVSGTYISNAAMTTVYPKNQPCRSEVGGVEVEME